MNYQVLNPNGRLEELSFINVKYNIDVLYFQDHKIYCPTDNINHNTMHSQFQLITRWS